MLTLGIDLGGTGIKLGLVEPSGKLTHHHMVSTPSKNDPRHTVELIIFEAQQLLKKTKGKKIKGIGIGAAGDIDPQRGVVRISPNLNWKNVPLKALISKHLHYPIRVDNDANVASWAAFVVEAKRKVKNLICVTVGTGVGGGIVLNGELYHGATGSAGEIGHMTLYPEGVLCNCGNRGCLERYVGARAMAEEARRAIETGVSTSITDLVRGDLSQISPYVLQQAARKGDKLSQQLWDQAGQHLGIGLASLVNVLNPEWIILAGGLSRAGDLLLSPLKQTLHKRSFPTPGSAVKLVVSKLDQHLGVVGAGLIAQ